MKGKARLRLAAVQREILDALAKPSPLPTPHAR